METQPEKVQYYNTFYADDDFAYYPPDFTMHVLRSLLKRCHLPPAARMLDVGCGTGYYTELLRRMGFTCIGIDISRTGVRKASVQYPESLYVTADALRLPVARASLDAMYVLGVSLINTPVVPDIRTFVDDMMRYLKPGGWLLLLGGSDLSGESTPNGSWFNHNWYEIRRFVPPGAWTVHGPYLTHFRLLRYLSAASLNTLTTWLARIFGGSMQRRIVYLVQKH
jgi:SAM-dependent methyltransferase